MAGKGKRFCDAGYAEAKPFIPVDNMPMVKRVMRNALCYIPYTDFKLTLITAQEHYKDLLPIVMEPQDRVYNVNIITVQSHLQQGQAFSCLEAKDTIDNSDELLIINCDQLVLDAHERGIANSIDFFRKKKCDGGILCFWGDNNKWSYSRISSGKIVEVAEKSVISNNANVGVFWFAKGSDFVDAAEDMIKRNVRVNNEFYVSVVYNKLISEGKTILPYMINDMVGIGTPEDLAIYKNSKINV